jgi:hypothetical protein
LPEALNRSSTNSEVSSVPDRDETVKIGEQDLNQLSQTTFQIAMKNGREIRQLWHTAQTYFEEAQKLRKTNKGSLNQKTIRIAEYYEDAIPREQRKRNLSIMLAHLSSGAVRLCTIDERFKEDHNCRITPQYDKDTKGLTKLRTKTTLLKNLDMYIHQMLRDNVGHVERSKSSGNQILWHARQEIIESLRIEEIFKAMANVMNTFSKELIDKRIL